MLNRIYAMISRYVILVMGSIPRMLSIFYWPSVQIILWGFFSNYLIQNSSSNNLDSLSFLLSAIILWDILFRAQLGLSMTFFEELWSRNLGHLLITPLRIYELVISLVLASILRTFLGLGPAILVANFFFDFDLFELGVYLIFFFINLIFMGWSIGFVVCGLVLRYGQAFEELAWAFIFILLPFSCVYYPIDALPSFFQNVALILPPVYVFEGMRSIINENIVQFDLLYYSLIINLVYFVLSLSVFTKMIKLCRRKGNLFNLGE